MIRSILRTDTTNVSYFIIRITLALVLLPHGLQKMFGMYGGYGFEGTMNYFSDTVGLPWIIGFLVIIAETFGAVLLFTGFFSRFMAASIVLVMIGAALTNISNGFFMNWFGHQQGEGVEFFILAVAMGLQVTIQGAGKWSLDGWLADKLKQKNKSRFNTNFETSY